MRKKKYFGLIAILFSFFLFAGCTSTEGGDGSSVSSLLGNSNSPEPSQSQMEEDPDSLEIKHTPGLIEQNRMNQRNVGGITQDARSYYYRHPIKGSLYRYDKETGKQKELFNQNMMYSDNGFLHSIKLFEDRIYFVTRTTEDEFPTLYAIDRNGQNLTRIISNVGDDYYLTKDYLYFTTCADPETEEWFTFYRLEWKTGEVVRLLSHQCEFLNFVGDNIYYTDGTFTEETIETSKLICKYELTTGKRTVLDVQNSYPKKLSSFLNLYYLDGSLYFIATESDKTYSKDGLFRYDLETQKTEKIITVPELIEEGSRSSTVLRYFVAPSSDHFFIFGTSNDTDQTLAPQYTLVEIIKDKKTFSQKELEKLKFSGFYLYVTNSEPVLVPINLGSDIIGLEELSRTVDDKQAA